MYWCGRLRTVDGKSIWGIGEEDVWFLLLVKEKLLGLSAQLLKCSE